MTVPNYPLERVLKIKIKRVEDQEKVVAEKRKALEIEIEKLKRCEEERDRVVQHKIDKLNQLRDELDKGTTSDKIIQMKNYIKTVDERIEVEEKKVKAQQEQVRIAEKNLEEAIEELRLKRIEVDKLETHREDWIKQMKRELEIKQEKEMDEIGQILYNMRAKKQ